MTAVSLDGVNDYVNLTNDATLWSQSLTKFSFSFWIYTISVPSFGFILSHDTTAPGGFVVYHQGTGGTQINFALRKMDGSGQLTASNFTTNIVGRWAHICCVFDTTIGTDNMKIYVDGVSSTAGNSPEYAVALNLSTTMKLADSSNDFNGYMKDFRWWTTKALTQSEINLVITDDPSAPTPNYWLKMDEGTGNPVDNISGTKVGTLTNGATWVTSASSTSISKYDILKLALSSIISKYDIRQLVAGTYAGLYKPLYIYPNWWIGAGWNWERIINFKSQFPFMEVLVVVNVNSGPDTSVNGDYTASIPLLKAVGIHVLGYIGTAYGPAHSPPGKSLANVQTEVDRWYSFYGSNNIDGILLDEMDNTAGQESYYSSITAYVKTKGGNVIVVGNPGAPTVSSYVGTVDKLIIGESNGVLPNQASLDSATFNGAYNKKNFIFGAYNIPTGTALDTTWIAMASQRVGLLSMTDDVLPNPYDSISAYLEDFGRYLAGNISKYDILQLANNQVVSKYDIRQIASSTIVSVYDLLQHAASQITSVYDILIGGAVSEITSLYDIRQLASSSVISKYDIRKLASSALISVYDIMQLAASTVTGKYDIRKLASLQVISLYNIFQNASATIISKYNIRQLASSTITSIYRITLFYIASRAITSLYDIKQYTFSQITSIYDIFQHSPTNIPLPIKKGLDVPERAGRSSIVEQKGRRVGIGSIIDTGLYYFNSLGEKIRIRKVKW
jgi:hypothetical protein